MKLLVAGFEQEEMRRLSSLLRGADHQVLGAVGRNGARTFVKAVTPDCVILPDGAAGDEVRAWLEGLVDGVPFAPVGRGDDPVVALAGLPKVEAAELSGLPAQMGHDRALAPPAGRLDEPPDNQPPAGSPVEWSARRDPQPAEAMAPTRGLGKPLALAEVAAAADLSGPSPRGAGNPLHASGTHAASAATRAAVTEHDQVPQGAQPSAAPSSVNQQTVEASSGRLPQAPPVGDAVAQAAAGAKHPDLVAKLAQIRFGDYHAILEVDQDASPYAVREHHQRLSHLYSARGWPAKLSQEEFQLLHEVARGISDAFMILGDAELRARYERGLMGSPNLRRQ